MESVYIDEEYLTVQEFCEKLKISYSTALRMIHDNQIPYVEIARQYRIPKSYFQKLNPRYVQS